MDEVVEARIYSHQPGSGLSTGGYMHSHRHSRCWHIGYKKKHAILTYTYIIEETVSPHSSEPCTGTLYTL